APLRPLATPTSSACTHRSRGGNAVPPAALDTLRQPSGQCGLQPSRPASTSACSTQRLSAVSPILVSYLKNTSNSAAHRNCSIYERYLRAGRAAEDTAIYETGH